MSEMNSIGWEKVPDDFCSFEHDETFRRMFRSLLFDDDVGNFLSCYVEVLDLTTKTVVSARPLSDSDLREVVFFTRELARHKIEACAPTHSLVHVRTSKSTNAKYRKYFERSFRLADKKNEQMMVMLNKWDRADPDMLFHTEWEMMFMISRRINDPDWIPSWFSFFSHSLRLRFCSRLDVCDDCTCMLSATCSEFVQTIASGFVSYRTALMWGGSVRKSVQDPPDRRLLKRQLVS